MCVSPEEGLLLQDVLQLELADAVQSAEVVLGTEVCRRRSAEEHLKGGRGEVHLREGQMQTILNLTPQCSLSCTDVGTNTLNSGSDLLTSLCRIYSPCLDFNKPFLTLTQQLPFWMEI